MTDLTRRQVVLGLTAMALMPASARAHHGWGSYDSGTTLTLNGTVRESAYSNPHGELKLATTDKEWICTLAPPFRMQNRGLTEDMLKPGTTCTVVGYPSKNNPSEMRAERIIVAGKTVELR